jgi:hypothetical protein
MGAFFSSQSLPAELRSSIHNVENWNLKRRFLPLCVEWHIREHQREKLMSALIHSPQLKRVASHEPVVFMLYTHRKRRRNSDKCVLSGAPAWAIKWYMLEKSANVSEATRSQAALDQLRNAELFVSGRVPHAPPLHSQDSSNHYAVLD